MSSYQVAIYLFIFLLSKHEILLIHGYALYILALPVYIRVLHIRSGKCYGFIAVCLLVD